MPLTLAFSPMVWLAVVLGALTLFAGGVKVGLEYEQGQTAQRELDRAHAVVRTTKTIIRQDNKALAAAQERAAQLEAENLTLQEEARRHAATIPDPAACHLHPDRVRTIRRAWGVGADPAGGETPLPGPEKRPLPDLGQPQRSGGLGGALGPQVSSLHGWEG
jgi:hypothetical protein